MGYGLGGGITFFHDKPRIVQTPDGPRVIPPDVTAAFGMATENGSWAGGAGHLQTWNDGRIRYVIGGGYGSLNLDWFGQGDAFAGRAFSYNIEAYALMQKLTFKLGASDFFFGPNQRLLITNTGFDFAADLPDPGFGLGIFPVELDSRSAGLAWRSATIRATASSPPRAARRRASAGRRTRRRSALISATGGSMRRCASTSPSAGR